MDMLGTEVQRSSKSNTKTTTASASSLSSTTDARPPPMRFIRGLQEIIHEYDVFLIDMWGVLHDGKQPYEHVLHTIKQMKQSSNSNKVLILLSNSSKRYHHSIKNLQQLGFHDDDFHAVITSGEVTYQMLQQGTRDDDEDKNIPSWAVANPCAITQQWEPLRSIVSTINDEATTTKNVFILGSGDDDVQYCTSCGWTPISDINDANLILARGPFTIPISTETVDTESTNENGNYNVIDRRVDGEEIYQTTIQNALQIAANNLIPMIVSNPDKVRPDADRSPMPGQIGDLYESILMKQQQGTHQDSNDPPTPPIRPSSLIKRIGKPFPDVYDMALQSLSNQVKDKSRICMIGDALETDITGGTMFGIDTVWVLNNGVHSIDIQNNLNSSAESEGIDILKSANVVLDTFNNNNIGTYAEGQTLSPTFVIPYFQW
jgi:HAD superfamily hydrolase (TIGR01450 family)